MESSGRDDRRREREREGGREGKRVSGWLGKGGGEVEVEVEVEVEGQSVWLAHDRDGEACFPWC